MTKATVLKNFLIIPPKLTCLYILFEHISKYNSGMKKFFYRVQTEDSLNSIAQKFNAPIGRLIFNNNLTKEVSAGDIIFVEQVEKVYLVKPLDTIEKLAIKFNQNPQQILEKNYLSYIYCGLLIEV